MKGTYETLGGRLKLEVEGDSIKAIIKQIGSIAEILDSDAACGCCSSDNIHPRCRMAGAYEYYELVCSDCGAQLSFGQSKDLKSLFPKRKESVDTRGWHVYQRDEQRDEQQQSSSAPRRAPQADDELERLVAKIQNAANPQEQEYILADLFHAITEASSQAAANKAWEAALRLHGPLAKDGAAVKMARAMWPALRG